MQPIVSLFSGTARPSYVPRYTKASLQECYAAKRETANVKRETMNCHIIGDRRLPCRFTFAVSRFTKMLYISKVISASSY
jgi:hypothetical protein